MLSATTSVQAAAPPEAVYGFLADLANDPEWRFDILDSQLVRGSAGEVGAVYRQRAKPGRKEIQTSVEIERAEPHRHIGFRTLGGPVQVGGLYTITAANRGCAVRCDVTLRAKGVLRLFEPLMAAGMRRTAARYEEDLSGALARLA